jgi:hypothetical protein
MRRVAQAVVAATIVALVGCGGHRSGSSAEHSDQPAHPPPGWWTVRNGSAGFTIAAPRDWTAQTNRGATVISSTDRLAVITVSADRSEAGRDTAPGDYARQTLDKLPGFEGAASPAARRVPGAYYRSAEVSGGGRVGGSRTSELITIAAFHRPGLVTYAAVVFRNARVRSAADDATLARMLRTFRAQRLSP